MDLVNTLGLAGSMSRSSLDNNTPVEDADIQVSTEYDEDLPFPQYSKMLEYVAQVVQEKPVGIFQKLTGSLLGRIVGVLLIIAILIVLWLIIANVVRFTTGIKLPGAII